MNLCVGIGESLERQNPDLEEEKIEDLVIDGTMITGELSPGETECVLETLGSGATETTGNKDELQESKRLRMWREHTAADGKEGQAALKTAKAASGQGVYQRLQGAAESVEGSYVMMKPLCIRYSRLGPDKEFN